ncbi:MAG: helix-hairpin-helix domain-containing protein [Tannerella sp.]|jgi:DNA uptake protein ComE-like DNA-binding protein|nr:helix-hairpin-helix domain-containing protein [Tannerella sp.]
MAWRDFFYFSKGERRAFVVFLSLIIGTGLFLTLKESPSPEPEDTALPPTTHADMPDTSVQTLPASQRKTSSAARQQRQQKQQTYARSQKTKKTKESFPERVKRMTSLSYPPRATKYTAGTTIEINAADTTELKKIPGIGTVFANRIVKRRNLLGGYYSITQLGEVYGIDAEKYAALSPWFTVDHSFIRPLAVNTLSMDSLRKHPYINYPQAKAIEQLRKQKKQLSGWENLQLLNVFTAEDKLRLTPYLSFE